MYEVSQGLDLLQKNAPSYSFADHQFKMGVSAYGVKLTEVCDEETDVCVESQVKESVSILELEPLIKGGVA
jgi:hypothetical protein